MKGSPLLEVEGLEVAFAGRSVVRDLSFSIRSGEKLALVGESGSGKTVTALSLLRLVASAQVSGRVVFEGKDLLSLPEAELRALRGDAVSMIFQEPMTALNPVFTVGQQVAEVLELKRGVARAQAWTQAVALLERTGIDDPGRRAQAYPHQLSGGQRQRAMIAMAVACAPRLLLADEPTTALDVSLRGQILDLLDELRREQGMAVLMITHDLNLVRRFADRVAVMEQGVLVEQGEVDRVFTQPEHAYTRRLIDSRPARRIDESPGPAGAGAPVRAHELAVHYPVPRPGLRGWWSRDRFTALAGAGFALERGRTLGVIGESGSGKSTLALAVLGLQACEGELSIDGRSWTGSLTQDRPLRRRIQVVFQDPFSSLSPRLTIGEIVEEGLRVHEPLLPGEERRRRAAAMLASVGLEETTLPGLLERYPHEFSGGQRQRIALARALILDPEVLVLDEPTSALDVTIQRQVLDLLQALQQARGLSYLLITHDVDVVAAMAHDVLVLKDGRVVEAGPALQVLDGPGHPYTRALVEASGRT